MAGDAKMTWIFRVNLVFTVSLIQSWNHILFVIRKQTYTLYKNQKCIKYLATCILTCMLLGLDIQWRKFPPFKSILSIWWTLIVIRWAFDSLTQEIGLEVRWCVQVERVKSERADSIVPPTDSDHADSLEPEPARWGPSSREPGTLSEFVTVKARMSSLDSDSPWPTLAENTEKKIMMKMIISV